MAVSKIRNGFGVIFNQETFYECLKKGKRSGTQADVDQLLKVFKHLNIDHTGVKHDLTLEQIKIEVNKCI